MSTSVADPHAEAIDHLRRRDKRLARWIDQVGPCGLEQAEQESVFTSLVRSIVFQQLNGRAAGTIHGRLLALFPDGIAPAALLALPDEPIRGAGVSAAKTLALRDLASRTLSGEVPTLDLAVTLPDEELVQRLTAVRGIGRWTVEMLLMFRLGRPDVLPVDDFGVRKGFMQVYRKREMPTRRELQAHGERWRPWRSIASWYLWRAADLAGK